MADEIVDQKARTEIAILGTRLDSHEKTCGDRYGDIKDSFRRVHGRLEDMGKDQKNTLRSIIILGVALIAYLLINGRPWGALLNLAGS